MARSVLPFVLVVAGLVAGAPGCSSGGGARSDALAPLRVASGVRWQLGGPLRGPEAPGDALPEDAYRPERALSVRLWAVEVAAFEDARFASVAERAKLVVLETHPERALSATPRGLATARIAALDEAAPLVQHALVTGSPAGRLVREARACLPAGASVALELVRDEPGTSTRPEDSRRSRVALIVGRRPDDSALDVALEREDPAAGPEVVALDGPALDAAGATAWAAVVPSPFEGDAAREVVLVLEVSPPPLAASPLAAVHAESLAEARRQLAAQAAFARALAAPLPVPPPVPDLAATLRALRDPATGRRSLYVLALATGARTAEQLAVSVDDLAFAPIASSVAAALWSATRASSAAELGIAVEHATLAACREVLAQDDVPDDLLAALERRGGAALRLLGSLGQDLDRAMTLDELERVLVAQNVQLLEDASPRVRVRAARWLAPRLDLVGYEPLATLVERRAAVQRIRERRARAGGP